MTEAKDVDVLIIGAGINGAGLFRDLCEQGVTCAIIDKGDFGSGTSAAPSRLIHGGLKYLETGEFGLVAQSTFERNLLLRNAPHLVRPLQTVIPMFSWFNGIPAAIRTLFGSTTAPRSRGALLIELGLLIYDIYGRKARVMPRHDFWTKGRAKSALPPLTDRIVAAGAYYDAKVSAPERLVLELIEDGLAAEPSASALNYASVQARDGDSVVIVDATGETLRFRPEIVVNAAGPWIDKVNTLLGEESHFIGGSKGSHIVLEHPDLLKVLNGRMIYFEADDGRILLVYDYCEGRILVGATDIRDDDPDNVRCEDDEISYFLDALLALLPGHEITREHIVYAYSGIRPLPASGGTAVGLVSRDHSVPVLEPAGDRPFTILSLVGGKWTTFRGFAEEVADNILKRLDRSRRCSTVELGIGGGQAFPADRMTEALWLDRVSAEYHVPPERALQLLNRYGTKTEAILAFEGNTPVMLPDLADVSEGEIRWICQNERVRKLADVVIRRTLLAVTGRLNESSLARITEIAGEVLGWTEAQRAAELAETRKVLTSQHRMRL